MRYIFLAVVQDKLGISRSIVSRHHTTRNFSSFATIVLTFVPVGCKPNPTPTVTKSRTSGKPFLINFQVEKEDGVYPMIAPGAALDEMIRRPGKNPLLETAEEE